MTGFLLREAWVREASPSELDRLLVEYKRSHEGERETLAPQIMNALLRRSHLPEEWMEILRDGLEPLSHELFRRIFAMEDRKGLPVWAWGLLWEISADRGTRLQDVWDTPNEAQPTVTFTLNRLVHSALGNANENPPLLSASTWESGRWVPWSNSATDAPQRLRFKNLLGFLRSLKGDSAWKRNFGRRSFSLRFTRGSETYNYYLELKEIQAHDRVYRPEHISHLLDQWIESQTSSK